MIDTVQSYDFEKIDPILRDIIPYCSDIPFIREEYGKSRRTDDPAGYLDRRINEENGSRNVDLKILQSRFLRLLL
jgi:hypothetical protein